MSASTHGLLLIISGPAGSGKTTLAERFTLEMAPQVERVITATTRSPRGQEKDGTDYIFLDEDIFKAKIASNAFYEYAQIYQKHFYGTPKDSIDKPLASGIDLILNIDVQGAASFREAAKTNPFLAAHMVTIFILPPSIEELKARLQSRNTDSEEEIQKRLKVAKEEIKEADLFDYQIVTASRDTDFACFTDIYKTEKAKR